MSAKEFFAEAERLNLRVLGTPAETRAALDAKDAEIERLNRLVAGVRESFNRECDDADAMLRVLGLAPENCRTEGGPLKLQMVLGAIEHRDVMTRRAARTAERERCAKIAETVHPHWTHIARAIREDQP